MKKLVASTEIVAGISLVLFPRFVLPACGYLGHPRMHCSDTAEAVMLLGLLLVLVGSIALVTRRRSFLLAGAAASLVTLAAAFSMPSIRGYCLSPKMPCHYGMVPAVRFIAVVSGLVLVAAIAASARGGRTGQAP